MIKTKENARERYLEARKLATTGVMLYGDRIKNGRSLKVGTGEGPVDPVLADLADRVSQRVTYGSASRGGTCITWRNDKNIRYHFYGDF
jgi:hypothetical protein